MKRGTTQEGNFVSYQSLKYLHAVFLKNIDFKLIGAWFATLINYLCGNIFTEWMRIIVALVLCDLMLGFLFAVKKYKISSVRFRDTFIKVCIYFVLIIIGYQASKIVYLAFLEPLLFSLIIFTELISIFENIELLYPGLIPNWVIQYLKVSKSKLKISDHSNDTYCNEDNFFIKEEKKFIEKNIMK